MRIGGVGVHFPYYRVLRTSDRADDAVSEQSTQFECYIYPYIPLTQSTGLHPMQVIMSYAGKVPAPSAPLQKLNCPHDFKFATSAPMDILLSFCG